MELRYWQIAARFDAQRATHQGEDEDSAAVLRRAEDTAEQVRAELTGPLTVQAKTDGAASLDAVADEAAASGRLAAVGRFGKRKARAEQRTATERTRTLRGHASTKWGTAPANPDRLPEWAGQAATERAESDPEWPSAPRQPGTGCAPPTHAVKGAMPRTGPRSSGQRPTNSAPSSSPTPPI